MVAHVASLPVIYEGRGSGAPLLMLHGRSADHRQMLSEIAVVRGPPGLAADVSRLAWDGASTRC